MFFSSHIPDIPEADTVIASAFDLANGNHQAVNGNQQVSNVNQQAVNSNNLASFGNHLAFNGNQEAISGNHQTANGNHLVFNGNGEETSPVTSDEFNNYRASLTISPKLNR